MTEVEFQHYAGNQIEAALKDIVATGRKDGIDHIRVRIYAAHQMMNIACGELACSGENEEDVLHYCRTCFRFNNGEML